MLLRYFAYKEYIINPNVRVSVIKYRPIKIYLNGEVQRPGYHVIPGSLSAFKNFLDDETFPSEGKNQAFPSADFNFLF